MDVLGMIINKHIYLLLKNKAKASHGPLPKLSHTRVE